MMRRLPAFLSAVGLVVLTSFSLAVFLFDHRLIILKKVLPERVSIFSNLSDLGPLWKNFLWALPVLALAVLLPGFLRSRRTGVGLPGSLLRQALTLAPLLFLVFGRFFYGKHLKFIFYLPLYHLLSAAVLIAVLWLNASLHFGFRPRVFFRRSGPEQPRRLPDGKKAALLLSPLILLFVHFLTLSPFFHRFSSLMVFTGDEPKYLRMVHSLASDGDLDLTDDFVGDEVYVQWLKNKTAAAGERAIGHFSVLGRDGGIYHFHMPGISFLMLPGYLLDLAVFHRDIPNTQALMFLPAKLVFTRLVFFFLALGLFILAARLFHRMFRSAATAALLLLALLLATKVPEFLFQVYPESAAIFFLLLGLNAVFCPFRRTGGNALALILAVGCLPWLHQRFFPLAAGLLGLFLYREVFEHRRWKRALVVSLVLAAFGLGYLYYFYAITGNPLPWSMYSLWGSTYTRAAILPSGFFGYLFDTGSGLLSLTPVFFFTLTGIFWGFRLDRRRTVMLLALALPYFLLISITPWHGLPWETTRMSLVLYPVFLIFVGQTLRALAAHTSWAHLVFYAAGLGFVLLNRVHRLWSISLGNVLILPHQIGYIIQCALVLAGFYLVLAGLGLWTKKRLAVPSWAGFRAFFRAAGRKLGAFVRAPALRKTLAGLALGIPAAYMPIFLSNWNDKSMALSYFGALSKLSAAETADLHPRGHPSSFLRKGDRKFPDIFRWEVPFELRPESRKTVVRFGPKFFADLCPAGCYKVDLEFFDPPPELTLMSLDFMRETREMRVDPRVGRMLVSTIYLVFDDRFISPEFVIRHEGRIGRPVRGRMHFFPIPSAVFDKTLMIRLDESSYPKTVFFSGPHPYLTFWANSRRDNARYAFDLALLPAGSDIGPEAGRPFATHDVVFRHRNRHLLEIRAAPPPAGDRDAFLSLSVKNASGRTLTGRSAWLDFQGGAWRIPIGALY